MILSIRQPPITAFMDDLTITTTDHVQARLILNELGNVAIKARMKFKPMKSRCMVIRNRKVASKFQLQVQGKVIPSIKEVPVKCLGKWYDASLNDRGSVSRTETQAEEWFRKSVQAYQARSRPGSSSMVCYQDLCGY